MQNLILIFSILRVTCLSCLLVELPLHLDRPLIKANVVYCGQSKVLFGMIGSVLK